jgi:hypothetical protein
VGIRKDALAHLGVDAIRADDDIAATAIAVGKFDLDAARNLGHGLERGAETDHDARFTRLGREDAMKQRPHDAAIRRHLGQNFRGRQIANVLAGTRE